MRQPTTTPLSTSSMTTTTTTPGVQYVSAWREFRHRVPYPLTKKKREREREKRHRTAHHHEDHHDDMINHTGSESKRGVVIDPFRASHFEKNSGVSTITESPPPSPHRFVVTWTTYRTVPAMRCDATTSMMSWQQEQETCEKQGQRATPRTKDLVEEMGESKLLPDDHASCLSPP